jgi:hypothetical protein
LQKKRKEKGKENRRKKEINKIANQRTQRRKGFHIFICKIVVISSKNYTLKLYSTLAQGVDAMDRACSAMI